MAEMERHFKSSRKPMFTYIQTMSAHWPYDYTYEPEVDVPGGGPGTNPEMHEYLRRVSMAKMDFDFLIERAAPPLPARAVPGRALRRPSPDGDAHAARLRRRHRGRGRGADPSSIGFVTYYAVRGINYRVPALPQFETLDVPYLGTVILDLAGLPLSDSHRERKRLMLLCKGRYYDLQAARRDPASSTGA